jgi:hypothetical protein
LDGIPWNGGSSTITTCFGITSRAEMTSIAYRYMHSHTCRTVRERPDPKLGRLGQKVSVGFDGGHAEKVQKPPQNI